jgi:hypothetical protein
VPCQASREQGRDSVKKRAVGHPTETTASAVATVERRRRHARSLGFRAESAFASAALQRGPLRPEGRIDDQSTSPSARARLTASARL